MREVREKNDQLLIIFLLFIKILFLRQNFELNLKTEKQKIFLNGPSR